MCGLLLLLAIGCGGGDDDDPVDVNPNDSGSMTARVDGAGFTAFGVAASYNNGVLGVTGSQISPQQAITFSVPATATGTVTVSPTVGFALYTLGAGNAIWGAGLTFSSTASGSVTITTLTSSRAVGTFSFVMQPQQGSAATGTKTITQGAFDVRF
jgi:hypothetical protein